MLSMFHQVEATEETVEIHDFTIRGKFSCITVTTAEETNIPESPSLQTEGSKKSWCITNTGEDALAISLVLSNSDYTLLHLTGVSLDKNGGISITDPTKMVHPDYPHELAKYISHITTNSADS